MSFELTNILTIVAVFAAIYFRREHLHQTRIELLKRGIPLPKPRIPTQSRIVLTMIVTIMLLAFVVGIFALVQNPATLIRIGVVGFTAMFFFVAVILAMMIKRDLAYLRKQKTQS